MRAVVGFYLCGCILERGNLQSGKAPYLFRVAGFAGIEHQCQAVELALHAPLPEEEWKYSVGVYSKKNHGWFFTIFQKNQIDSEKRTGGMGPDKKGEEKNKKKDMDSPFADYMGNPGKEQANASQPACTGCYFDGLDCLP